MDAQERIKRRRDVILDRQRKFNNDNDASSVLIKHGDKEITTKAENQVAASVCKLKQELQNSSSELSRIKLAFQNTEVTQQIKNECLRELNFSMTKKEDELSETESSLNELWCTIEENKDVRDIYTMLERLKVKYSVIFQRKDVIIKELRQRICDREEDYLTCLREGEEKIDSVRNIIEQSLISMETLRKEELKLIDGAYNEERNDMIKEYEQTLTQLLSQNSMVASDNIHQIAINYNEKEDQKLKLQNELDLEFDSLKAKLLDDVAKLERELSVSKCFYDINIDQIGYNYRDLNTKNNEHAEIIKKRRSRLSHFKGRLRQEIERFRDSDNKETKKILTLEADCKRLEGQHRNLVSKLHRFEIMEDQKYQSAMIMYKDEESNLNARIKQSNIYISNLLSGTENESETKEDFALQLEKLEIVLVQYSILLEEATKRRKSVHGIKELNGVLQSSLIEAENNDISKSLIIAPL